MFTYFFDITMDGCLSIDFLGTDFATASEARLEANKIAAELVFDHHPGARELCDIQVTIIDDLGRPIGNCSMHYNPTVRH